MEMCLWSAPAFAWVQFINFWELDFGDDEGKDKNQIKSKCHQNPGQIISRVPGRPCCLVFSDCTIANYSSVEMLLSQSTNSYGNKVPGIVLDQKADVCDTRFGIGFKTAHLLYVYDVVPLALRVSVDDPAWGEQSSGGHAYEISCEPKREKEIGK